jgi:hypothetical protein
VRARARRNPSGEAPRGQIARDDSASGDNNIIADRNVAKDDRTSADKAAATEPNVAPRCRYLRRRRVRLEAGSCAVMKMVNARQDLTVMRKQRVITDVNLTAHDIEKCVHCGDPAPNMKSRPLAMYIRVVNVRETACESQLCERQQQRGAQPLSPGAVIAAPWIIDKGHVSWFSRAGYVWGMGGGEGSQGG